MAITVLQLTTQVSTTLNDIGEVRWEEYELFDAVNDAQKAILEARPDLFETYASVELVDGIKQSAPADSYKILDIMWNEDNTGKVLSGITRVRRADLDRCRKDWPLDPPHKEAAHWMQDDRERSTFYVYPPQPKTAVASQEGWVQMRYAKRPALVSSKNDSLSVPDEMNSAVYHFCVMRLLEKDEKFSGSPQSVAHMQKFAAMIGARTEGELQADAMRAEREGSR